MTLGKKTFIKPEELLVVWRRMNESKRRTWISSDFTAYNIGRWKIITMFETLCKLGLVKQVPVIYRTGRRGTVERGVKGFRLDTPRMILSENDIHNIYDVLCMTDNNLLKTIKLNGMGKWFDEFYTKIEKSAVPELYTRRKNGKKSKSKS